MSLHLFSKSLRISSTCSDGTPFSGNFGRPLSSSTPIIKYPPDQLSISFAKAVIVFNEASGFQLSLNSIRAHSTTFPERRVFIFIGNAILLLHFDFITKSAYKLPEQSPNLLNNIIDKFPTTFLHHFRMSMPASYDDHLIFASGRFSWNTFLNCDSGFAFLF